jgi:hypothetical protein
MVALYGIGSHIVGVHMAQRYSGFWINMGAPTLSPYLCISTAYVPIIKKLSCACCLVRYHIPETLSAAGEDDLDLPLQGFLLHSST